LGLLATDTHVLAVHAERGLRRMAKPFDLFFLTERAMELDVELVALVGEDVPLVTLKHVFTAAGREALRRCFGGSA
jgi:hypothetical protein